jgi:hypothetical protein
MTDGMHILRPLGAPTKYATGADILRSVPYVAHAVIVYVGKIELGIVQPTAGSNTTIPVDDHALP